MNEKVLKTLEYHKIIEQLALRADSEPGKSLCRRLTPLGELVEIEQAQQETYDALGRLLRKDNPSFDGNYDLGSAIKSLERGGVLSLPELLHIAGFLENVARVKQFGRTKDDEARDSLSHLFSVLNPLSPVSAEIRRCLLDENTVADDASPALRHIRRSITNAEQKIHSKLTSMVSGQAKTYLQEQIITIRNNRYCIPVKSEYKNSVPGMIHDQSSTGATFFIEPAAVVELNNQLRELALKEQEEIEAVIAALCLMASAHCEEMASDFEAMTRLDFIFAKASLALEQNATRPIFNEERRILIRSGRHPLLEKDKVVPIDVNLGVDFHLLIVTGPNTGGKTVLLKTIGLLSLMGQAGLHIPAKDRSELAVFREVYADIGDEQSIEQSLSTFSSHMTAIVNILKNADEDALCLFDELGAGTDPTEGAALAIAILDFLRERHIRAVATTHYSEIKLYALSTEGVENASCEFDLASLRPTYRLLIGLPGKSNAFAISEKLGLPPHIIEYARERLHTDEISFEDIIRDLSENQKAIEEERLEIGAYKAEIEALKEELKEKKEKIEGMRERILREAEEEAREILGEAKSFADLTIRTLQKAGISEGMTELETKRQQLNTRIKEKNEKLSLKSTTEETALLDVKSLKIGDKVKVISLGLTGIVNALSDHKGNVTVQCGSMRTYVPPSDLALVSGEMDQSEKPTKKPRDYSGSKAKQGTSPSYAETLSYELNLIGKTVNEAIPELDKYLDSAYLAHLTSARIVHGKGSGILRKAVHSHLKKVRYVASYRLGEYGEGDSGVTVVSFK